MPLPSISVVTVTAGRTDRLNEALECFLRQEYHGQKQLLILNTFPAQKLEFLHANVSIVNLPFRPASLGVCRNYAVNRASNDVIVVLDDDDLMLPHHLTVVGEAFQESQADWVRVNPVFYAEGWRIKSEFETWVNSVAFTKVAFKTVGGYSSDLSVGEDRLFFQGLSEKCKGVTVQLKPEEISCVYNWANNVFHVSGLGDDKPGEISAWERSRLTLQKGVDEGYIPRGVIQLQPGLEHDPVVMAKAFLNPKVQLSKKKSVAVVELGRFGDIVNMLPIAKHIHDTYDTPHFVVSREFASVLDGVSYVRPQVVHYDCSHLNEALDHAKQRFDHVINCQVWGRDWKQDRLTEAYNRESWHNAGFGHKFNDVTLIPCFDNRDAQRETILCRKLYLADKPKILVQVTKALSSPFDFGPLLLEMIYKEFKDTCEIVDVSDLQLPKIYDLVGVIEAATVLVSIDTALIHFAAATTTPVVALINPNGWAGTALRFPCVARIDYAQAASKPKSVLNAIHEGLTAPRRNLPVPPTEKRFNRTIIHCVERHKDAGEKEQRRKEFAQQSWQVLYDSGVVSRHYWEYRRNAMDIGDPRPLPYFKDLIEFGMALAGDEDIVMWTNDDVWLHPELPEIVNLWVCLYGTGSAHRTEIWDGKSPLGLTPTQVAALGPVHAGRDMIAATKRWWQNHWTEIEDYILGASDFDWALAAMMRLEFGIQTNRQNIEQHMFPSEIPMGYVAHHHHHPKWMDPNNVHTSPSQRHNRSLFQKWSQAHLPNLRFDGNLCLV